MRRLVRHIRESIERDKRYRAVQKLKDRENLLWDRAGRPTGPGCDQSWKSEI